MLFQFTYFCFVLFLFSLLPASYAHAGVTPQLGVNGKPKRSDVQRPSKDQVCGNGVNIAAALDTSTAVPAATNGDVKVTVLSFNAGADGSRKVTAQVDPSGTGKISNFVKMTITDNGDPAPKNTGSEDVVAKLPAGTKCTGGSKKNKCLVQFVTTSGFGNCVVVSQGPGAGGNTSSGARAAGRDVGVDIFDRGVESPSRASKDPGGKGDNKRKQKKGGNKKGGNKKGGEKRDGNKKQAGTRAPRALLVELGRFQDDAATTEGA